jgi:hypothetical protein
VIDGKTGFLLDDGEVDGMAPYMPRLAVDADEASRLGQQGKERVRPEFSLDKSTMRLWQSLMVCPTRVMLTAGEGNIMEV